MNIFKNKTWRVRISLFCLVLLLTVLVFTNSGDTCPYCNKTFYDELLNSRGNTLGGRELLASIQNQEGISGVPSVSGNGENAGLVNPVSLEENPVTPGDIKGPQDFIEIIKRDESLPIPTTSYVPQNVVPDKKVTIKLAEGETYIGRGVMFKGFTTNGTIPGPTIIVDEGDIGRVHCCQ